MITSVIRQRLHFDHMGRINRRDVIAAIARVRHRLEEGRSPEILLPDVDPVELLFDLCREMGLDSLETVEAVGAHNAVSHLYLVGLSRADSEREFSRMLSAEEPIEMAVEIGGDSQ